MWGRGGNEFGKGCSVVNLQEFGQWAFPAGYLWVRPSLLKKGFPSSLLENFDLSSQAQVTCPLPWEAFPSPAALPVFELWFPKSLFPALTPQQCPWILCLSPPPRLEFPLVGNRSNPPCLYLVPITGPGTEERVPSDQ